MGLVDELGNYYDALNAAGAMAGIEGTPQVKEFKKQKPWSNLIMGEISDFVVGKVTENLNTQGRTLQMQTPRAEG